MGAPHEAGLIFSGRDSGTATRMKQMSSRAMAVARITTSVSPYACDRYAPMAGLVTRLAANVADTYKGTGETKQARQNEHNSFKCFAFHLYSIGHEDLHSQ